MRRRQTVPRQWLIVADPAAIAAIDRLPRGSGVLVLNSLSPKESRQLCSAARRRHAMVVQEAAGTARRVHNMPELRRALLARTSLVLLSPLRPTQSHPEWKPIPRMRAAAMARLGRRSLVALGGMDARKFARIKRLGFQGWAGISAFRT